MENFLTHYSGQGHKSKRYAMRRTTVALTFILLAATFAAAETTIHWWGLTSFRQRHEITNEFTDISFGGATPGTLLNQIENSTTRLGYQFGFKAEVRENITAGLTLRSGLSGNAQVMHQEITNKDGLLPAVQEAFINWKTPYFRVEMGKIPQQGNALWDVYTSTLQTDFRQDDPRDGIFNDRLAALNGARISRSFGPIALRGLFHADYVAGNYRKLENASREFIRSPDRNVYMLGTTLDVGRMTSNRDGLLARTLADLTIDFDYGFPKRAAKSGTNPDSIYADETLWGATLKRTDNMGTIQIGYAYNWRDSVFTMTYLDAMAQANLGNFARYLQQDWGDFTLTCRYQTNSEEMEFIPYKGSEAVRTAFHLYANKSLWGLDLQPRIIWFTTEIDGFEAKSQTRYELTSTVKF
jgi:hypothetical protein